MNSGMRDEKQTVNKEQPQLSKGYIIFATIGGIILFIAFGYTVRMCVGIKKHPQYTIGIVTKLHEERTPPVFDYVFFVDGIMHRGSRSISPSSLDFEWVYPGDTVYVIYEEGWPENNVLKKKRPGGSSPLVSPVKR